MLSTLREFSQHTQAHAEIRALLLRGAEAVLSGTLTKDGADALVELCDAVVAIDVGARA